MRSETMEASGPDSQNRRLPHNAWPAFVAALAAVVVLIPLVLACLPTAQLARADPSSTDVRMEPFAVPLAAHAAQQSDQRASTSTDWSGYATSGGMYTSVTGAWTQPSVSCATSDAHIYGDSSGDSYAAFWVGLDGDTTRTVEQIGTESDCQQGASVYYAWYEMYPEYPVTLSQPVAAGDHIAASVRADGSGAFTLTLADATQHWTSTVHATSTRAQLGSAEWIAEAPSSGRSPLPLAPFGTVTFTDCHANGTPIGDNSFVDAIALASPYTGIEAQPSGLSAGGTSFSIIAGPSTPSGYAPPPTSTQPAPEHHHHWHDWGWTDTGSGAGF